MAAFIEGYRNSKSPGSSRRASEQRRDPLDELEDLVTPDVEGIGRSVRSEEIEPVANMLLEFNREVEHPALSLNDAREGVRRSPSRPDHCLAGTWTATSSRLPDTRRSYTLIDRHGSGGSRVHSPAFRRRGFASAVTAHVTRHLLERGARVMLFTDAANPTSNGIYHDIGYRWSTNWWRCASREWLADAARGVELTAGIHDARVLRPRVVLGVVAVRLVGQHHGDGVAYLVDDASARVVEDVLTRHVEQRLVIDGVFSNASKKLSSAIATSLLSKCACARIESSPEVGP